MREIELFTQADQMFTNYVAEITDAQWTKRVPSTPDWTVRQLVNHVAQNNVMTTRRLAGDDSEIPDNILGDEPKDGWVDSAQAAEAIAAVQTNLNKTVEGPTGAVTVPQLLMMQTADRTIHSWDLAHAIGADESLEEGLVQAVYDEISPQIESLRAAGIFSTEVEVGPDASLVERLIALTGRDPDYSHNEPTSDDTPAQEVHRS